MNEFLPFLVIGITTGSVFAIAALGLVLTYRTSGIFNMGHGAIAAACAYSYYYIDAQTGLPPALAVSLVLFVVAPAFGLGLELLSRRLGPATTTNKLVGTVGLLLSVQASLVLVGGRANRPFPQFLPQGTQKIGGVVVGDDQLITIAVAVVSLVALYTFLRSTRTGIAMRAVVESSDLVGLTGTSPASVRRTGWILGSVFAALSGLLIAPTVGLDSLLLTLLVVQAFGAAAVGSFSSLPLTYAGAMIIGLFAAFATKYSAEYGNSLPWLEGIPSSIPFIVLFLALCLLPKGRLQEVGAAALRQSAVRPLATEGLRRAGGALALGLGILVPFVVGPRLPIYTAGLAYVAIFGSLGLLVRTAGLISLAQMGFAAVGGAGISYLTVGVGVPWPLALLLSGLVAVPLGALIAIPALRLSGLFLALATFGFGILLENLFYRTDLMFTRSGSVVASRPGFWFISAESNRAYYYVALAVVAALLVGLVVLERSRLGRLLRAMSDSPLALTTRGTNVNATRVLVFCISAFIAAIGGALLASVNQTVNGATYPAFVSLVLLAVLTISTTGTVAAPILAALGFVVIPSYLPGGKIVDALPILFGSVALLIAMSPYDTSGVRARLSRWATASSARDERSPLLARLDVEAVEAGVAAGRRPLALRPPAER